MNDMVSIEHEHWQDFLMKPILILIIFYPSSSLSHTDNMLNSLWPKKKTTISQWRIPIA